MKTEESADCVRLFARDPPHCHRRQMCAEVQERIMEMRALKQ